MKHKLTVLACFGLALLLSTNIAFAQNTITVVGGPLARCASGQQVTITLDNADDVGAIGLPLSITNGTIDAATAGGDLVLSGTGVGGFPGAAGVANAYGVGGECQTAGGPYTIWTLDITTGDACDGNDVVIDTAFFPPAGAVLLADCGACPLAVEFNAGVFPLVNQDPVCETNDPESVNFDGVAISKQLNASDPDVCDNASLEYALVDADGLTSATISLTGLFEYTSICDDKGAHTVTFSVTDQCGGTVDCMFNVEITNDAPVCEANPAQNLYWQDEITGHALNASDLNGNALTFSLVGVAPPFASASAAVSASGDLDVTGTDCDDYGLHTITFRVNDGCDSVDCPIDINVTQNAPTCQNPADEDINWLEPLDVTLVGNDDGCKDPLTWEIVSESPAPTNAGSINGNTYHLDPDCADLGQTYTITVRTYDGIAYSSNCSFDVEVINPAPTITCPNDIPVAVLGDLVEANASATDPYNDPLQYALVSFGNLDDPLRVEHNPPSVDANSGHFSWQTESSDNNDEGLWEACLEVADGCGGTDTCCFTIDVLAFTLCVGDSGAATDSIINAFNGETIDVCVKIADGYAVGGMDLLLCYDQSGLTFLNAFPKGGVANWEYFTWRHSPNGNCVIGCPTGYIRIVAIADLDNGPDKHPDASDFLLSDGIVGLSFFVTQDRNFIGSCLGVGFCTLDCGDNTLSSKSGDTLFIPIGSDISCIDTTKEVARDIITLCNGRICVQEPPDDRGDLNLNGVAHEIGDAVLYTNYFIYGEGVFQTNPDLRAVQILASDVNDDGIVLTVADLIYLIRVITGDVQPFPPGGNPKTSPYINAGQISTNVGNGELQVSASTPEGLGGALFVFRYSGMGIGQPVLSPDAEGMNISSNARNGELRVLIHPDVENPTNVAAGTHALFSVPLEGNGSIELVDNQLSDVDGQLLSTRAANAVIPTQYSLLQNYPNPFNAGTVIPFDLKSETDWNLQVYNVAGQLVRSFSGRDGAGQVQVTWDGSDQNGNSAASGVYFYRIKAGDFQASRKMTLLK